MLGLNQSINIDEWRKTVPASRPNRQIWSDCGDATVDPHCIVSGNRSWGNWRSNACQFGHAAVVCGPTSIRAIGGNGLDLLSAR